MPVPSRAAVRLGTALALALCAPRPGGSTPASDLPDPDLLTLAERTGFAETGRYDEMVASCRRLAQASPWLDLQSFGATPQGRDLVLVVASKERTFTQQAARKSGKLVVLLNNCIHAGECAGKDASLMLLRDLAVTRERADLLDQVILVVVPVFNADGHERFGPCSRVNQDGPQEMGWRSTAQRLNLNRDWLKADAPEMRALLAVWNRWNPHLHFDTHTTNGAEHRYDLLFTTARRQDTAEPIARWVNQTLYPSILPQLRQDGHTPAEYFGLVDRYEPAKGVRIWPMQPRYSTGYGALRNRPSILVEAHAYKPYRVRVAAVYDIIRRVLEELNRRPHALREAVRQADEQTVALGRHYDPQARFPLRLEVTDQFEPFTYEGVEFRQELSEVSGGTRVVYGTRPVDVPSKMYDKLRVTAAVAPPLAYLIPPEWSQVSELLEVHDLRYQRLTEPVSGRFETYRFAEESWADRPYEGHHLVTFTTTPITEERTYPAGSILVPLDQPGAKVAIHLFEPDSPDSLMAWGFFDQIFAQIEYGENCVLEELARKMLADDPALKQEFEQRIRQDRDFAGDPRARLWFFYRRSPYWDDRKNVYPVARVTSPLP